ncbi:hypothetical protein GmHk_06G017431 [Glycine max]|nr:hypothetical protein GmHk_06G017431 [Glycine max]
MKKDINDYSLTNALGNHDEYFQTRFDVADIMSLSPLQKCTITICVLAYKSPANNVDYYVQIGETTARECLETFVRGVNQNFGIEYLRRPNNNNTQYLLQMGEAHGFLDMLGANNDISVLNQSHLFNDILQGEALVMQYD